MRYLTIVHSLVERVALEDIIIGGQLIRAGEVVLMNLPAGNWDPDFVDDPTTFDIGRNAQGHLGLGYGVHQCIGANLARVELQVAFATLARRLPSLQLAVPLEEVRFQNEKEIYGTHDLPAAGILSGITGFGATGLLVVDDAHKNMQEADSPAPHSSSRRLRPCCANPVWPARLSVPTSTWDTSPVRRQRGH